MPQQVETDTLTKQEFMARMDEQSREPAEVEVPEDGEPTTWREQLVQPEKAAEEGKAPEESSITTLNGLAEKLGVNVADLYGLDVGMKGDGKTVTLGQLKDLMAEKVDYDAQRLVFEENRTKQENELLRAKQELQSIVSSLPANAINPEVQAKIRAQLDTHQQQERLRALEVIPSWSDEATESNDRNGIAEHLAEYGFDGSELDRVIDHRLVKYMRDNWQRKILVDKATKQLEAIKPKAPGKPAKPATQRRKGVALTGNNLSPAQLRDAFGIT